MFGRIRHVDFEKHIGSHRDMQTLKINKECADIGEVLSHREIDRGARLQSRRASSSSKRAREKYDDEAGAEAGLQGGGETRKPGAV